MSQEQNEKFSKYSKLLFDFAHKNAPFECKDITMALTNIRELKNAIQQLKFEKRRAKEKIKQLKAKNNILNSSIHNSNFHSFKDRANFEHYCAMNKCFTITEFVLFGFGLFFAGFVVFYSLKLCCSVLCGDKKAYKINDLNESIDKNEIDKLKKQKAHNRNSCSCKQSDSVIYIQEHFDGNTTEGSPKSIDVKAIEYKYPVPAEIIAVPDHFLQNDQIHSHEDKRPMIPNFLETSF